MIEGDDEEEEGDNGNNDNNNNNAFQFLLNHKFERNILTTCKGQES